MAMVVFVEVVVVKCFSGTRARADSSSIVRPPIGLLAWPFVGRLGQSWGQRRNRCDNVSPS